MPQPRQQSAPMANLTAAPSTQEGSRWINGRPSGPDFVKWFKENVHLHDGLDAARYATGVVLISGKEKHKVAKQASNGSIVVVEEERLVHTPYAKVETRIAYFWDLMAKREDWVGVIEPGPVVGGGVEGLPPGFFKLSTLKPDGKVVNFVCSTMRVRILKADTVKSVEQSAGSPKMGLTKTLHVEGVPVAEYPAAVKMIPAVDRYGAEDPFALMKAETGAVGRALGMAGMLVIPGSGVATAEDMIEAQDHQPSLGTDPELEAQAQIATAIPTPPTDLRQEIADMVTRLEEENPGALEPIRDWAKERKIVLADLTDTQLRGVHRKLSDALASES